MTEVFDKILDAAYNRGMSVGVNNDIARLILQFEVEIMQTATFIRWWPEKYQIILKGKGWPALLWEGSLIPPPKDADTYFYGW